MKIKQIAVSFKSKQFSKRSIFLMKLSFYPICCIQLVALNSFSQNKEPLNLNNASLKSILNQIDYGEIKQITLSDGSVVWLNAVSKISYEEESPRTIQLNGEAFFEVAKDKANPFTVEIPDHITVKALGSSFNVKAYPDNSYLETALLTGKVEVTSKTYFKEKIIMLPNDKIRINKADGLALKAVIKNEQTVLAWKEGKIRFENMTFKDIANELSNQLNVKLVFENEKIAKSKFTAVFDKSTSIKNILEVLKMSKEFNYNQNKETDEWMIE
ncbi:FecR family protein [Flavivirga algicola]|uniref:DUF4974 domain-containing protein n=1 Tax=Flavivirga algicola TaxID=2729136 RepID=A0ABX1RVP2_9FLAO|nr:FecR domain-containing protein [Flavivirga algicola]NMH86559.1 DUF4974 domain-containing protein [Flavivirga algicola]